MHRNEIQLLSTGPLSQALKSDAANKGISIEEVSFIRTEEIVDEEMQRRIKELSLLDITVVFTSSNAVNMVAKYISPKTTWKIFCIANATKMIVKELFPEGNIIDTAYYGGDLAERIIENSPAKIIFFCGDQRRDELPEKLRNNGIEVEEITVYKTIEIPEVLSKQYDGILFFSPSAVRSFFSKNEVTGKAQIFAIGSTTAREVKNYTQQFVHITDNPGKGNLVKTAINHFSKNKII
jgi:uroporphyrinogen-III synthase